MWPFRSKKEHADEIAELQRVVRGTDCAARISKADAEKRLARLGVKPRARAGGRDFLSKLGT